MTDLLPLSLGQVSVWRDIRDLPSDVQLRITLAIAVLVPPDTDEYRLRKALHALSRRHEVLRTRFVADPAGNRPGQRVLEMDELELAVSSHEARDDPAPITDVRGRPVDLWTGLASRAVLVTRHGKADQVVLELHHLATDYHGLGVLAEDLERLLSGAELDGPPSGPRTLVELEHGEGGRRNGERAVRRWRDALGETLQAAPDHDRVVEGTLTCDDLLTVVQQRARDARVPVSAVLLDGYAHALHRTEGAALRLIRTMVSNRVGRDRERLVASMNQWAPILLPVGEPSLPEVAKRAMLALRSGVYDVDELQDVLVEAGLEPRLLDFVPSFNLVQVGSGGAAQADPGHVVGDVTLLRSEVHAGPRNYLRAMTSDSLRLVLRVPDEPGADDAVARTLLLVEERIRSA